MRFFALSTLLILLLLSACSADDEQEQINVNPERTVLRQLGDGQVALPYQGLAEPIRVRVIDRSLSNAVGEVVTFSVLQGGGNVLSEEVLTNDQGVAQTRWTLGGIGPQVLQVSVLTSSGEHAKGSPMEFTASFPLVDCSDVIDADGNQYPVVIIGNRCWTVENLRTTKFQNGDDIPLVSDNTLWSTTNEPAMASVNNDPDIEQLYGKLYNWYAVNDARKLCPTGWHVATTEDYNELVQSLGGPLEAGGKMKFIGTNYWNVPNTAADNASGFSAVGASFRHFDGQYFDFGNLACFWTAEEANDFNAWMRYLYHDQGNIVVMGNDKHNGLSVRCVAD